MFVQSYYMHKITSYLRLTLFILAISPLAISVFCLVAGVFLWALSVRLEMGEILNSIVIIVACVIAYFLLYILSFALMLLNDNHLKTGKYIFVTCVILGVFIVLSNTWLAAGTYGVFNILRQLLLMSGAVVLLAAGSSSAVLDFTKNSSNK